MSPSVLRFAAFVGADIQHEMNFVLTSVYGELERDGLGWGNVLYIHLYIDDMGAFTVVNQTYMQHITEQLCIRGVPSRSTVGLALKSSGMGSIMVEVIASENTNKKVLHVQSISCWAPSCIGPYSQATLHNGMLYMAGQLGLDPPTMVLVSGGAASEMKQALENCEAVAQIFSTSVMHSSISILVYCSLSAGITERRGIEAMLDKFIGLRREGDASRVSSSKVPVLYVQVPALPKGAVLEVEPFLHVPCCQEGYNNEGFTLRRDFCGLSDEACQWESSACHGSIIEGSMCRAFCSISLICKLQSSDRMRSTFQIIPSDLGQPDLQWELKSCLQAFSKMLDKACLCWEDMLAFRVLFVAEMVSLGAITEAWKHALTGFLSSVALTNQEVPQKYTSTEGLTSLEPLFLPVLGVGQNANMDDLVTIDLLALKL